MKTALTFWPSIAMVRMKSKLIFIWHGQIAQFPILTFDNLLTGEVEWSCRNYENKKRFIFWFSNSRALQVDNLISSDLWANSKNHFTIKNSHKNRQTPHNRCLSLKSTQLYRRIIHNKVTAKSRVILLLCPRLVLIVIYLAFIRCGLSKKYL